MAVTTATPRAETCEMQGKRVYDHGTSQQSWGGGFGGDLEKGFKITAVDYLVHGTATKSSENDTASRLRTEL